MSAWETSKKYPGVRWRTDKAGDQVFYITYSVRGKKIWKRVGSRGDGFSAALAASLRGDQIREAKGRKGRHLNDSATFGELWDAYLVWAKAHKRSWQSDEGRYRNHLQERFARRLAADIEPLDLEKMQAELLEQLAPATARQVLMLVSGIYTRTKELGISACENPAAKVKPPRVDNARERALTPEELGRLFDDVLSRSAIGHGLAFVGYHTGARLGEICGLTWPDIDLAHRSIAFRDTKTGGTRRVKMNRALFDYLTVWKEKAGGGAFVFTTEEGGRVRTIRKSALERSMDRLFNQGIADRRHRVVFHTLRHSFITHLVSAGIPLTTVQKIVGHTTLAMMQRYAHLVPGAQEKAMEVLEG